MFGCANDLGWIGWQHDVAALIVADDLRLRRLCRCSPARVSICEQADHRNGLVGRGRDGRIDVAMLVHVGVRQSEVAQFLGEQAAEILCFSVEGQVGDSGSDWVSMRTWRRKRSVTLCECDGGHAGIVQTSRTSSH